MRKNIPAKLNMSESEASLMTRLLHSHTCLSLQVSYVQHRMRCNIMIACALILFALFFTLMLTDFTSRTATHHSRKGTGSSDGCNLQYYLPQDGSYDQAVYRITHLLTLGDDSSYETALHSSGNSYWNQAASSMEQLSNIRVRVSHVAEPEATLQQASSQLTLYFKEHGERTGDATLAVIIMLQPEKYEQQSPEEIEASLSELETVIREREEDHFGRGVYIYVALPADPTDGLAWLPSSIRSSCSELQINALRDFQSVGSHRDVMGVATSARGWAVLDLHDVFLGHGHNADLSFGPYYYSHGNAEKWLEPDSCYRLNREGHAALSSVFLSAVSRNHKNKGC